MINFFDFEELTDDAPGEVCEDGTDSRVLD